jgi:hypothetical protein
MSVLSRSAGLFRLEFMLSGSEVSRKNESYSNWFQILISLRLNYHLLYIFHFPFEASKGNKNASIFKVPSYPLANIKKISPCRCLCFASWQIPLLMAKPKRLHKPLPEIFLRSTAKIGFAFGIRYR